MSNMTPKKAYIVIAFDVNLTFHWIFNPLCNSIYVLPVNGL